MLTYKCFVFHFCTVAECLADELPSTIILFPLFLWVFISDKGHDLLCQRDHSHPSNSICTSISKCVRLPRFSCYLSNTIVRNVCNQKHIKVASHFQIWQRQTTKFEEELFDNFMKKFDGYRESRDGALDHKLGIFFSLGTCNTSFRGPLIPRTRVKFFLRIAALNWKTLHIFE